MTQTVVLLICLAEQEVAENQSALDKATAIRQEIDFKSGWASHLGFPHLPPHHSMGVFEYSKNG